MKIIQVSNCIECPYLVSKYYDNHQRISTYNKCGKLYKDIPSHLEDKDVLSDCPLKDYKE